MTTEKDNDNFGPITLYGVFVHASGADIGRKNAAAFIEGDPLDGRNRLVFERTHRGRLIEVVEADDIPGALMEHLTPGEIAKAEEEALAEHEGRLWAEANKVVPLFR